MINSIKMFSILNMSVILYLYTLNLQIYFEHIYIKNSLYIILALISH